MRVTLKARTPAAPGAAPAPPSPAAPNAQDTPKVQPKIIEEKKAATPKRTEKKTVQKTEPAVNAVPDAPVAPRPEILPETPAEPGVAEDAPAGYADRAVQTGPAGPTGGASGRAARTILDASSLKVTKKVAPDYPMISRKRKEAGTVVLLIEIASGRVESVEVESSSGHAPLDESAVRAVRAWTFDAGHTGAVTARIPFKFDLK
jgi:protein TonB